MNMRNLVAWAATAAVIFAGGLALYLARGALAPRLASLPDFGSREVPIEDVPVEDVAPAFAEPTAEEPSGPRLTYEEIEAALAPLPARVLELIADGRRELPEYRAMSSRDETKAARGRRFFQTWGRTWSNRLAVLENDTPPLTECEVHAALEPACGMLAEAYGILRIVPGATKVADAQERLDQAQLVVETFLNPPEEEEEDAETGNGVE